MSSKITVNEDGKGWTQWYSSSASHLCCFVLLCLVILFQHLYKNGAAYNRVLVTHYGFRLMEKLYLCLFVSITYSKEDLMFSPPRGQDPISGQEL